MSRKAVVLLILAVLLVGAGAAAGGAVLALRLAGGHAGTAEEKGKKVESPGKVVTLQRFFTDLADRDRRRFVDVTLAVLVNDEAAAQALTARLPEVRDAVLGHLRSQGSAELLGAAGKERLAEDLQKVISPLVPGGVRRVYVTDMLVQ